MISIMQSLGELTTLYPSGGAFTGLADRFVDKAFGVAVGWNYYIIWFCVLANEYNVISSIFTFWGPQVPVWGYFLIFWVGLCFGLKLYFPPLSTCQRMKLANRILYRDSSSPSLPSNSSAWKRLARPSSGSLSSSCWV